MGGSEAAFLRRLPQDLGGGACKGAEVSLFGFVPSTPTLLWFRQDLRLQDNPALHAALARGAPIIPIFILDDAGEGNWRAGGAPRWWLHQALASLDGALREHGSRLVLLRGNSRAVLRELVVTTGHLSSKALIFFYLKLALSYSFTTNYLKKSDALVGRV